MADLRNECSQDNLRELEAKFNHAKKHQDLTPDIQFQYAVCLVKRNFPADIERGIYLLKDLVDTCLDPDLKAEYIYFIGFGNAQLKKTRDSLQYMETYRELRPSCSVGSELYTNVRNERTKEVLETAAKGFAAIGAIGAIALGVFALNKSNKKK